MARWLRNRKKRIWSATENKREGYLVRNGRIPFFFGENNGSIGEVNTNLFFNEYLK